jgi:hypothetical protein
MSVSSVKTRKLLVSYDQSHPERASSDFLAPVSDTTGLFLFGLKSKKTREQGLMVYVGKDVTVNDLAAKLVDSGRRIENVSQALACLEAYIRMLQEYRIGNILTVEPCSETPCGFRLKKVANSPPVKRPNLP